MTKTNETYVKPSEKRKRSLPDFATWAQGMLQANQEEASSKQSSLKGQLQLISTPIGNLGDISLRALWALSQVDAILCEDTRVTGAMLSHYGIRKPLISCHDYNEESRIKELLDRLSHGEALAFVSDAGTPLISDPGYRLARACRQAGFPVYALPGASAVLCALACAGLPSDRFLFVGFLPNKKAARQKELTQLQHRTETLVFYESPQRLVECLSDMAEILGPLREAFVARELTKLFEEHRFAQLETLLAQYQEEETPKGEVVLIVNGASPSDLDDAVDLEALLTQSLKSMSLRDAVDSVTAATGLKKKFIYQKALDLSQKILGKPHICLTKVPFSRYKPSYSRECGHPRPFAMKALTGCPVPLKVRRNYRDTIRSGYQDHDKTLRIQT